MKKEILIKKMQLTVTFTKQKTIILWLYITVKTTIDMIELLEKETQIPLK